MLFDPDSLDNWQKKRLKRLNTLRDYLKEAGTVEKKKLLGELGKSGIYRATAENYLRDLQDAGDIQEKKGNINWIVRDAT